MCTNFYGSEYCLLSVYLFFPNRGDSIPCFTRHSLVVRIAIQRRMLAVVIAFSCFCLFVVVAFFIEFFLFCFLNVAEADLTVKAVKG